MYDGGAFSNNEEGRLKRGMEKSGESSSGEDRYEAYVGRLARGAGVSSVGQGIGRAGGYATQVVLARMLGPAALGLYVLGTTVVAVANILAQFGMDSGVVRYVAHHRAEGDVARVRGTILLALGATFLSSVALGGAMFFGAGFLAGEVFGKPRLEGVLEAFSVSVPFLTVMSMALWATQGFQTVKYATYVQQIFYPLANLLFVVALYFVTAQVLGAVFAFVISTALGSFLALYSLARVFPGILDRRTPPKFEGRALFGASGPMLVVSFMDNLNIWAAVTVLGVFATAGEVGVYNAAARTAALSTLVLLAFRGIFTPMVSELHGGGRREEMARLYRDVSAWIFTGSLAVFLLTALLSRDVMAIFGEEFMPGWPAVVVIASAQLFNASVGLTNSALAMTGHQKTVMFATIASAAALVAGSLALVPAYGVMGAAAATAISITLVNTITLFALRVRLGFWAYSRRYAKPMLAGLLAAAALVAARYILAPSVGAPAIILLSPLFLVAFGAALVALRLSPGDRRLLASLYSAARRVFRF